LYIIPKKLIKVYRILQYYVWDVLIVYLLIENSYFSNIISLPYSIQLFNKINNNKIYMVNAALTSEQKDALLYLHRKTREDVEATNMQPLYWSSTLAAEAQVIIFNLFFFSFLINIIYIYFFLFLII